MNYIILIFLAFVSISGKSAGYRPVYGQRKTKEITTKKKTNVRKGLYDDQDRLIKRKFP